MHLTADNVLPYALARGLVTDSCAKVESLTGGVSCAAFRLHPADKLPVVIKQTLAQLRVKAEWFSDPERSQREAFMLDLLHEHLGPDRIPELLFNDTENFIVAMSSAPLSATNWKADMLAGKCFPAVATEVGRILGSIQAIPLAAVPKPLYDKQYFRQLRIEAYILWVADKRPDVSALLRGVADEIGSHQDCLTHGDYTPKNLLVDGERVIVLDFEVGHVGHPAFDVASIVNHLFLKTVRSPEQSADFVALARSFINGYISTCPFGKLPPMFPEMLGALMLARVHGKSPVEYLGPEHAPLVTAAGTRLLHFSDSTQLEDIWPG